MPKAHAISAFFDNHLDAPDEDEEGSSDDSSQGMEADGKEMHFSSSSSSEMEPQ